MPTLRSVLVLALGLASAASIHAFEVRARPQDDELAARLERAAEQFVAHARIPALALAIDVGGEPLLERGWGERAGRPVGAHTAFPAGSLAAQCIASGVLELVERGDLRLEARVGEYVAELADDPRPITLEHLLAHASGLPPLDGCPAAGGDSPVSPAAMLAWLREAPSIADAGHCLAYSDSDTFLLGLILERVGGMPVRAWIEERVLAELELEQTRFDDAADARATYGGGQEITGRFESDGDGPALFDAHALRSSARDLARLQRAWIEGELVSDQSWVRMTSGGHFADGSPTQFGLGFGLTPLDGQACVSFGGRANGARLFVAWYPGLDLTIALVAEGEDAALPLLERRLARLVHGLPQPELQDLALTPEERAPYLGDYYMGCTRHTIAEGPDGRLRALTSEPGERVLLAQGGHLFVAGDDVEVRYRFELDEGRATAFVLDERGSQSRAVRID
jgi:D-alanyl-D-alanine carboxypeptidase